MSYTLKNLRDVDDSAARFGYSETQESRFPRADLGAERTGLAFHLVKAGKRQAFGHRHHEAEEVVVVVRGSGRAKLDDDVVELRELDALRIAPGVARAFEGGPDGLQFVVFGPHVDGDGELLEDFWPNP